MTKRYDDALVNYDSSAFNAGFEEGLAGNPRRTEPADSGVSEIDWASYCEGWLMGSCEAPWTQTELTPQPTRVDRERARDAAKSREISE